MTSTNEELYDSNEPQLRIVSEDLVKDEEWDQFIQQLTDVLMRYDKIINVLDFLGEIRKKIQDCSRAYTGMWILEMMHAAAKEKSNKDKLPSSYHKDLLKLQKKWEKIMSSIRDARKELLGKKCIEFFYSRYAQAESIYKREYVENNLPGTNGDKWYQISKKCNDIGLQNDQEYKNFLSSLLIEMVKY